MAPLNSSNRIGSSRETSLHTALKDWYMVSGDTFEVVVDGYLIDIVRGDLLIEIQTRNFAAIKRKLVDLVEHHNVRLVYPIPKEKWIVYAAQDGQELIERRKSPKRGHIEQLFSELVSFPKLVLDPNFSLEVLLVKEEELRYRTVLKGWSSKGWSLIDRRLLEVKERVLFRSKSDYLTLLPPNLRSPFTSLDLSDAIHQPRYLSQKMVYCLRSIGVIDAVGKIGNSILYAASKSHSSEDIDRSLD